MGLGDDPDPGFGTTRAGHSATDIVTFYLDTAGGRCLKSGIRLGWLLPVLGAAGDEREWQKSRENRREDFSYGHGLPPFASGVKGLIIENIGRLARQQTLVVLRQRITLQVGNQPSTDDGKRPEHY